MMAARRALEAAASAGCSHCRASVFKLFLAPTSPYITSQAYTTRRLALSVPALRRFSAAPVRSSSSEAGKPQSPQETEPEIAEDGQVADSQDAEVPWYLQSLLEYTTEEMGLEELSLLNLRELNPPAALGPNLIMLFGNARSERHLHVSASRLVRWLRYQHKVHADADGLLGPNERKTKLRRKAKRAKFLGTMGTDDADDGISTGWICVNLGTLNRSSEDVTVVSEDGRVAGFGVPRKDAANPATGIAAPGQSSITHPPTRPHLPSDQTPGANRLASTQSKSMSTSSTVHSSPTTSASSQEAYPKGHLKELSKQLRYAGEEKLRALELLHTHVHQATSAEMKDLLASPAFDRLLALAIQDVPSEYIWSLRLALECRGRQLRHPSYSGIDNIRTLVTQYRTGAILASREQCLDILSCIYSASDAALQEKNAAALDLLGSLQLRGQNVITNDVIVAIIEAISMDSDADTATMALQTRLEVLLVQARLPYMGEDLLVKLLGAYARQQNWDRFWEVWRMPPQYMQPRSESLYLYMYRLMTRTQSSTLCASALRRCFPEMLKENPPVQPTHGVREAVLGCVRLADPRAEEHAATLPVDSGSPLTQALANREFVKLVRSIIPSI
ncbi:ATPase synthesis protein 25- mitochondrial [Apiospora phragmitis]|uniref:ATPase synthesis protein 25 n=1 Tax=Apiospora phragmitis TaxID=2905665 RepID=A0ABR1X660_9PEZI